MIYFFEFCVIEKIVDNVVGNNVLKISRGEEELNIIIIIVVTHIIAINIALYIDGILSFPLDKYINNKIDLMIDVKFVTIPPYRFASSCSSIKNGKKNKDSIKNFFLFNWVEMAYKIKAI